jgi:hypothetical protein
MTNEDGKFCGKMPKGKVLKITVSNFSCAQNIETFEVGPFQNNTQLNDFVIKKVKPFKIVGKLHCNNDAVKKGFIITKVKDFKFVNIVGEDGAFSLDLTPYTCGESIPVSIFGFDNENTNTSPVLDITSPPTSEISLNVCSSDCTFTADMVYDCKEKLEVKINGGSGNFTYKWEDNTTESFIKILPDTLGSKIYCLTVTDVTNACEKVLCKNVGEIRTGIESQCGNLYGYYWGGIEPVNYNWSNGSTLKELKNLAAGTYCLTVTDANGCTSSVCTEVSSFPPYLNTKPSDCNKHLVSFSSDFFQTGYFYRPGTGIFGTINYPISINVLNSGFIFNIDIQQNNCNEIYEIKLPQMKDSLAISTINTTCSVCTDGKLNINLNANADCYECKIGQTKIFSINDLNNDLTSTNNNSQMAKGEYYVVVTDANTGCYIAFRKVIIQ